MSQTNASKPKMSAIEFDEFMKERTRKRLENTPIDAPGVVCGCYFDVPAFKDKNVLVECALCGIPLYVRPWIYEITKTRDLKICCQYCMPPQLLKGTLIQDIAAVLQKTGEK